MKNLTETPAPASDRFCEILERAGTYEVFGQDMCENKPININEWPRAMPVDLAARYIGLAPKTLRNRLCRRAENPFPVQRRRQGGKVIFFKEDLDKYLDNLPVEEPEPGIRSRVSD